MCIRDSSFTYRICNLDGLCDTATVSINIEVYEPREALCSGFNESTIMVADNALRVGAVPLDNVGFFTLNGDLPIYIFATVPDGTQEVRFFFNDVQRQGQPINTEFVCTYDLRNPNNNFERAFEFDDIGTGFHDVTIEVVAADGSISVANASFGLRNI